MNRARIEHIRLKRLINTNSKLTIDNAIKSLETINNKVLERELLYANSIHLQSEIMQIKHDGNLELIRS